MESSKLVRVGSYGLNPQELLLVKPEVILSGFGCIKCLAIYFY